MAQTAQTDVGFQGGQVLSLRVTDEAYEALTKALADSGGDRWHTIELPDERIQVDLAQVVYVRRETGNRSVGF